MKQMFSITTTMITIMLFLACVLVVTKFLTDLDITHFIYTIEMLAIFGVWLTIVDRVIKPGRRKL